jgi:hypothetical protein
MRAGREYRHNRLDCNGARAHQDESDGDSSFEKKGCATDMQALVLVTTKHDSRRMVLNIQTQPKRVSTYSHSAS